MAINLDTYNQQPVSPQQTGGQAYAGTQAPTPPRISSGPIPGQSSDMTALGIPDSDLRKVLFQMTLANPKAANTLKSAYDYIKPQAPSAAELKAQKAQEDVAKAKSLTDNTIGNLLTQYSNLSDIEKQPVIGKLVALNPFSQAATYNQQRTGLYASLKEIAGAGAGSGVRINNYDINLWAKLLPEPGDTPSQIKTKIKSLDTQIKGKFGTGLDPEYLHAYGVK